MFCAIKNEVLLQAMEQEDYVTDFKVFRLKLNGKDVESEAVSGNGRTYKTIRLRSLPSFTAFGSTPPC